MEINICLLHSHCKDLQLPPQTSAAESPLALSTISARQHDSSLCAQDKAQGDRLRNCRQVNWSLTRSSLNQVTLKSNCTGLPTTVSLSTEPEEPQQPLGVLPQGSCWASLSWDPFCSPRDASVVQGWTYQHSSRCCRHRHHRQQGRGML